MGLHGSIRVEIYAQVAYWSGRLHEIGADTCGFPWNLVLPSTGRAPQHPGFRGVQLQLYTNLRCLQFYNTWSNWSWSAEFARQPALTWQAVCTRIVARGLKCYHPRMNRTWLPSAQLCSYGKFYLHTLCSCVTFTFDLFIPKLAHATRTPCSRYMPILTSIDLCIFQIFDHKMQNLWPRF